MTIGARVPDSGCAVIDVASRGDTTGSDVAALPGEVDPLASARLKTWLLVGTPSLKRHKALPPHPPTG